jgi:integration host factor subunit alpha
MTLTKAEIAEQVHTQLGRNKKESARMVEALFEMIKQALGEGKDVVISGFGRFSIRDRGERRGRNPITGAPVLLPAKKVVTFTCSGKLREKINGKKGEPLFASGEKCDSTGEADTLPWS